MVPNIRNQVLVFYASQLPQWLYLPVITHIHYLPEYAMVNHVVSYGLGCLNRLLGALNHP